MNYNSNTNQNIKSKFVGREIFANVNSMVEYIINKSFEDSNAPFSFDDIENYYNYPEYYGQIAKFEGGTEDELKMELDRLQTLFDENNDLGDEGAILETEIQALNDLETEPAEIFEWYVVSGWLCEKLKLQGECVIESENLWGRQTTGQAILLDAVISRICEGMEILEGQAHAWE